MIIGFTGTSSGMTGPQMQAVRQLLWERIDERVELRHGDCVGADAEAHAMARGYGMRVVIHPPSNPKARAWCCGDVVLPAKPYLARNRDIVEACELLIAAPRTVREELRSGTWATVRHAAKVGRRTLLVSPSGEVW